MSATVISAHRAPRTSARVREAIYRALFAASKKAGNTRGMRFFAKRIYNLDRVKNRILVKYICKELLLYFVVSFVFFFVVFFVNQMLLLAETVLQKRVPVGDVARLILYRLPNIVSQSAPFATLVGFLMCLGRLVTENEVLILRATGQRYSLILKCVLAMGMGISIFSFIMNDYFLPLGTIRYNRLYRQIIVSNPAIELESNSIRRMEDMTFVIGDVTGNRVSDLVIFDENDNEQRVITAGASEMNEGDLPGVLLELDMENPVVTLLDTEPGGDYEVVTAGRLRFNIFEDSIIPTSGTTSPREMTSWDLAKLIREMREDSSVSALMINRYDVELNRKFSLPFGSFFFALLAFPLALIFGRRDGQTLGLIFGLVLSVAYWAANILGQMFGIRSGYNAFVMMWSPNLVLGALGILLYLRLRRK